MKDQLVEPSSCGFRWILVGAIGALLAVACGAFGAHQLEPLFEALAQTNLDLANRRRDNWRTASQYQMYHSIGIILIGAIALQRQHPLLNAAGFLMVSGTVIFSGMLYLLVLTETKILGAIVPIGGIAMMAGWVCLAVGAWLMSSQEQKMQGG